MGMKSLESIRDMLCEELDTLGEKGAISGGDLETIHKLTDTIKNIDKIEYMEEEGYSMDWMGDDDYSGRYSRRGRSYDGSSMNGESYGGSYRSGYSGTRRNSMGRYSRADGSPREELKRILESGNLNSEQKTILRKAMEQL